MIEVYVKCDVCGKSQKITYTRRETIAIRGTYCPDGWVARWTGKGYMHICPYCLKQSLQNMEKNLKKEHEVLMSGCKGGL